MTRLVILALFFAAGAAGAQNQDIQRQLIQRDQQTDAFALQLRQSVEAAKAPAARRPELEARQLWERQRLDNLNEKQLLEKEPGERLKAGQERCAIVCPSPTPQ
jgi:hypothetical protein